MLLTSEERAARKKAQLARLAAKGRPDYSELYASQPDQVAQRKADQAARAAARAEKAAKASQNIANADGAAAVFEGALETKGAEK